MTSAIWKLAALKTVCCGGPLLILLVASGAVAVVDVALGAAVLGLVVVGGWLLWRRRRACACELPALEQRDEQLADASDQGSTSARRAIASWRAPAIEREERMT